MDLQLIVAAGIAVGTILLFAAVGEILAERSGVLNLGVEGMMLIGAVVGFATAVSTGNAWLGVATSMLAGGLLSLLHAIITITFRADQVVSGLALTFLGTGLARVLGRGAQQRGVDLAPAPVLDPAAVRDPGARARSRSPSRASWSTSGYLLIPATWYWINRTRRRPPPARGGRGAGRRRRAGRERVRDALPVRDRRRDAGRPRRGDDHARDPAGLVRCADRQRARLDRRSAS